MKGGRGQEVARGTRVKDWVGAGHVKGMRTACMAQNTDICKAMDLCNTCGFLAVDVIGAG